MAGDSDEIATHLYQNNVVSYVFRMAKAFHLTEDMKTILSWLFANFLRESRTQGPATYGKNAILFKSEEILELIGLIDHFFIELKVNSEIFENSMFCLNCISKKYINEFTLKKILSNNYSLLNNLCQILENWTDYEKESIISYFLNFFASILIHIDDENLEVYFTFRKH